MNAEKLHEQIQKLTAKVSALKFKFCREEYEARFEAGRADTVALLEEMSECAFESEEAEIEDEEGGEYD